MNSGEGKFAFKGLFFPLTTKKAIIFIFIIGIAVFFNSLFNGFVGDDFDPIVSDQRVHSLSGIPSLFTKGVFRDESGQGNNYYRAFTSTAFSLIYVVFGGNAFGFHLTSILIHIINAILIFLIFKYFFKKEISFLISILFLVHPINTEAVVYASALGESLVALFGLLALYTILRRKNSSSANYLTPFFLFLSLLSKETGILFLFLFLLFGYLYQKKELAKNLITALIVLSVYLFLRLGVAHIGFGNQVIIAPIQALPLDQRIISIPKIIFFYITTFFYPRDLIMFQTWLVKNINFMNFYLPIIFNVVFFGVLIYLSKIVFGRNPKFYKIFIFFLGWFLVSFAMLLQVVSLDQTVSERWFYLPLIGLLGIGGTLFASAEEINNKKVLPIILIIIVLFSVRVMVRNTNWYDEKSLYTHDIKYNGNSYQLETGLGKIADSEGNIEAAQRHYVRAAKLFPSAVTFGNLASYYLLINKAKEAVVAYTREHSYNDTNPISWAYLGMAKYKVGDKNGAIEDIQKAYSLSPNNDFLVILETIKKNEPITFQR
jgi:protein O-mannosyl-transferase